MNTWVWLHLQSAQGCQERLSNRNNTRPYIFIGTYTESDNGPYKYSALATGDYIDVVITDAVTQLTASYMIR